MNSIILIGNLTKDPEMQITSNNVAICKFTVAVTRKFSNQDGSREADFIPVVAWRGQAENCGKYLKKGSRVAVRGALQLRNYEGQDGARRYVTEVIADEVQFLTTRSEAEEAAAYEVQTQPAKPAIKAAKPIADGDLPF